MLLTIQTRPPLKGKLEALARAERRTLEDQAVCLIDNALRVFEGKTNNRSPKGGVFQ